MQAKSIAGLLTISLTSLLMLTGQAQAQAEPGLFPGGAGSPHHGELPPRGRGPDFIPPGLNPDGPPGHGPGDDPDDDDEDDGLPFCARGNAGSGPSGQAGLSSIAHLNFSAGQAEDDPDGDNGNGLETFDGWARMMYRWYAPVFDYVFNGHQLADGEAYTLTYQPQPVPSPGVICLGDGVVNNGGNLHIQDAFDIATDLPAAYDENEEEAILALVLSADIDCDSGDMLDWQPEHYLFGDEGMFYVHSDLDDEDENGED
jgi:hypothetical protein